jgi:uncharacterized membrane protein
MSHTCLATFTEHTQARVAVRRLMHEGIAASAMEAMSSQPIHGEAIVPQQPATKLRNWAFAGAAVGLMGGLTLATVSALNYPLVKGGMPIVSPWTASLITYETTMLGAVLGTFVGLLVESRLPTFKNLPYESGVVDGGVVLAVSCPDGARASVEAAVGAAGATKVNWMA